jgi:hypothetical protein
VPLDLVLTDTGKIKSQFFGMPRHKNDSLARIEAELGKEPYRVAFHAETDEGQKLLSHAADQALSISRSNQIFILRAAKTAITEGKLKLTELVPLRREEAVKTMGSIHFWKDGTLISVDSLLSMMVAERDLAASDLLLSRLDPATLTGFGQSLKPFLSYREYFLLAENEKKDPPSRQAVAKLLPGLKGKPLPELYRFDRIDLVNTLGWFASPRELCQSALAVKEDLVELNARLNHEYQSIHPKAVEKYGLVQTRDSGISQVTVVLKTASSPWICIALTANHHDEVEEGFFSSLYTRLMSLSLEKATTR